jgi:hypothetical protein
MSSLLCKGIAFVFYIKIQHQGLRLPPLLPGEDGVLLLFEGGETDWVPRPRELEFGVFTEWFWDGGGAACVPLPREFGFGLLPEWFFDGGGTA